MEQYNVEQNYLTGINPDNQIPDYFIQDSNKLLRVNENATGLQWTTELDATGYISERGDGSSNTADNYVGYIFKNQNYNTGLFNYSSGPFNILALRINNMNVLECTAGQINANQNIFFSNDSLLSSQRINFGVNACGISGDSTTGNQHKIVFRTDNQERLRIGTTENILCKSRIQIDPGLIYSLSSPHIYQSGMITMGISFDATNGTINISSSGNSLAEFKYDRIDLRQPVIFRNPQCFPDLKIIIDSSYTVPANLSGNGIYYMKRGTASHSDIILPQPVTPGFNPRYEIITDSNTAVATYSCRLSTLSNDIIFLNASTRTILSGPLSNYVLALNAHFILNFVEQDNRWVMIRMT